MEDRFVKSGIIMVRDGKVLLVRGRYKGKWGFPKGHLEEGETLDKCAHREFREETGMSAVITEENCVYNENSYYYLLNFRTSCLGHEDSHKHRSDRKEILDVKWFPIKALLNFDMTRSQVNRDLWAYMNQSMKRVAKESKLRPNRPIAAN